MTRKILVLSMLLSMTTAPLLGMDDHKDETVVQYIHRTIGAGMYDDVFDEKDKVDWKKEGSRILDAFKYACRKMIYDIRDEIYTDVNN